MNDRDELEFTPEERALQERVERSVRTLPAEPPAADFRARMRERFVAGAADAPGAVRAVASGKREGFFGMRPIEVLLASTGLAIVLGLGAYVLNTGPKWQLASSDPLSGNLVIDDEAIPVSDAEMVNGILSPDSRIVWEGSGELMLHSPGGAVIAILPGTEMTLPKPPPRWFARSTTGRVDRGEIRIMTGPQFAGARFTITTPQASVAVTGTALAVICEPAVTCVCVLEGKVRVDGPAGDRAMVPAGQRRTLFADGRPTEQAEMRPAERVALARLKEAMQRVMAED